jgi:hypothetical protein
MLASTHTQELVIALCGPIGSPLHEVGDKLKEMLQRTFGYERCEVIRLSAFIVKHSEQAKKKIRSDPEGRRNDLITIGDEMRRQYGHSVLAELAVNEIRVDREIKGKNLGSGQYIPRRVCHIIDSIKNQEEMELLRTVYREALYVVGVFAPVGNRVSSLQSLGLSAPQIAALMDRDSGEELN